MIGRLALFLALLAMVPACADAAKPIFSFTGTTTVAENAGQIIVFVAKNAKAPSYSKVNLTTVDGTAKAGTDYKAVNATQTVANSQLSVVFAIPIIDNVTYQGSRSFTVKLTGIRNADIATPSETITITDNEAPPAPSWTLCAYEGQICNVSGTANIRFGYGTAWLTKTVTGPTPCSTATFGDPLYGTPKECQTTGTITVPPGSAPNYQCPDGSATQVGVACGSQPAPTPAPVQCPDGTTVPAGQTCPPPPAVILPAAAPIPADHATLDAAVGTTMTTVCPTACDARPKTDPKFNNPINYGSIYPASVADGQSVKILGWFLDYAGKVQWHVAFANGQDGWLYSGQLR